MGNRALPVSKKQILIAALLVLFVFLLMDLNSRLTELSRQSRQRDQMQTEASYLMLTEAALQGEVEYATSEAAVEDWAREQGHMQRPGDVVIIPMPAKGATPSPVVTVAPTITPVPRWQVWRVLLLGE